MHEGVLQRLELRTDLQRALATDQLELYYQPVIRLEDGDDQRRRGAAALEPSRARHGRPRPVHPAGRGVRPDRADRPLGPARGLPRGPPAHGEPADRPARRAGDQPVAQAAPALRHRHRRARGAGGVRPAARAADAGDHRERPDGRHRPRRAAAGRAQGAGHQARARRLRHRLLVAELPVEVPGRRPEDGPLVPAGGRLAAGRRPGQRGRRAGLDAVAGGRRRGHRDARAVEDAARPRLRAGPGLLLRATR